MRLAFVASALSALAAPVLGVVITTTETVSYIQTCPYFVYTPYWTVTDASVTKTLSLPSTTTSTFYVTEFSLSGIPIFTLPTPPASLDPSATYTTTVVDYPCTTTEGVATIPTTKTVYSGTTTTTAWAATETVTSVVATLTYFG
ncbi:hypothetical protein OE88DRAFT_1649360 [Heliocybe sulcata]|uniref:Uncharacterized protein n=1 Tax=Heliocybe sulcata TaxID=5364 RepID=A0A5C3MKX3_9AGAM|nr:hypothetical protein OE88DRAFT_1649360 [Heliocybe sulcata]